MFKNIFHLACFSCLFMINFSQPLMAAPSGFIFTVDSQPDGTFTIPTYGTGYKFNVDCDNDGGFEAVGQSGNYTCDYTGMGGSGIYTIRIEDGIGDGTGFPRVRFDDLGEAKKITQLSNWGTGQWDSMDSIFEEAKGMTVTATDVPNLTNVKNMSNMFHNAVLANPDTSGWDTTHVTNMSGMFNGAKLANPDTSDWITTNVTDMSAIFRGADTANPDVSNWDTVNVTDMRSMFYDAASANPDTSNWDTSSVTNMLYMFAFTDVATPDTSSWDITSVLTMFNLFRGVILPTASYDAMLVHFSSQAVQSGIEFHGGISKYCASDERDKLINNHGWIITDGGLDSSCDDIIFRNSFEIPVTTFTANEKQFEYDFAILETVKLDGYPELIAVGLDAEQKKIIKFHVRKIAEQMQIRISDLDQDAFEENTWINQDWQNINNNGLTTVNW